MKRDCPTIQELLAFDAVARHEADARGRRPVHHRERGQQADRGARGLPRPRPAAEERARRAAHAAGPRLLAEDRGRPARDRDRHLRGALGRCRRAGLLTLASVPTFLTKWLIPRLPAFSQKSRHVMLSFSRHLEPSDGIPAGVDAAIRYGPDGWPGVVSEYIAGREFVLIVARSLVEGRHRIAQPADILGHTLLHHEGAPTAWRQWAAQHGVPEVQTVAGPRFAQYSALIQCRAQRPGHRPWCRSCWCRRSSPRARCSVPAARRSARTEGHYLCYRPDRLDLPAFAAFAPRLLDEGQKSRGVEAEA